MKNDIDLNQKLIYLSEFQLLNLENALSSLEKSFHYTILLLSPPRRLVVKNEIEIPVHFKMELEFEKGLKFQKEFTSIKSIILDNTVITGSMAVELSSMIIKFAIRDSQDENIFIKEEHVKKGVKEIYRIENKKKLSSEEREKLLRIY